MTVIYLDEINTEEDVLAVTTELQNVVIQAVTATQGKRQKIASAEMQVQQIMKKCGINRWKKATKTINLMMEALQREAKEYTTNMWSL